MTIRPSPELPHFELGHSQEAHQGRKIRCRGELDEVSNFKVDLGENLHLRRRSPHSGEQVLFRAALSLSRSVMNGSLHSKNDSSIRHLALSRAFCTARRPKVASPGRPIEAGVDRSALDHVIEAGGAKLKPLASLRSSLSLKPAATTHKHKNHAARYNRENQYGHVRKLGVPGERRQHQRTNKRKNCESETQHEVAARHGCSSI